VWRKNLRTDSFQAKRIIFFVFINFHISVTGLVAPARADSAVTAKAIDSAAETLFDSVITSEADTGSDSLRPADTTVDSLTGRLNGITSSEEDTGSKARSVPEEVTITGKDIADSMVSTFRKKTVPPHLHNQKKLISVFSTLRKIVGRKLAGPLKFITGITTHRKKILFFSGLVLLVVFIITAYSQHREKGRFLTTTRLSIMDKEVQRACRYIEDHYDDPDMDPAKVCRELVTGEAFLEALFIKELGLTVENFIAQVRINRAKIMLHRNRDLPVAVLAESAGFIGEKPFLDRFERITGTDYQSYKDSLSDETAATDA
jgi:AraC-like DNA-binding protein